MAPLYGLIVFLSNRVLVVVAVVVVIVVTIILVVVIFELVLHFLFNESGQAVA